MNLPHNLEAEQALLGALMFDNGLLEQLPPLEPGAFYDPVHGRIFNAIKSLIAQKRLADGVTLKEFFATDDGVKEIGGAVYLLKLMEHAAPLAAQAVSYAHVIRDLAARRQLIAIGMRLSGAAQTPPEGHDAMDLAIAAERELQAIGAGAGARDVSLREAAEAVVESLSRPWLGLATGIAELDNLIGGLVAPDLVIMAARPSMGKTSLAVNIAYNIARGHVVTEDGHPIRPRVVVFFSLEMNAEQLGGRALSRRSTMPGQMAFAHSDLNSRDFRPNPEAVTPLLKWMPETLRIDDTPAQLVASMRAQCRDARSRFGGLDLVVVDYLQLASAPNANTRGSRFEDVTAISGSLKALAKDMRVPVLALSQLSRQVEARADKIPQMSDLRESGALEQDADIILFLYREHFYLTRNEPTEREGETRADFEARKLAWIRRIAETKDVLKVICAKRRHGPVGTAELYCDLAHDVVSDPQRSENEPRRKPHWLED